MPAAGRHLWFMSLYFPVRRGSTVLQQCREGKVWHQRAGTANRSWDQAQQIELDREETSHMAREGEWKKGAVNRTSKRVWGVLISKGEERAVTPWTPHLHGQEWGHASVNHRIALCPGEEESVDLPRTKCLVYWKNKEKKKLIWTFTA